MHEQGFGLLTNKSTTPSPPKVPKYSKDAHIMETWGFPGSSGLRKEGHGITEPILVQDERPKGLGLGEDSEGPILVVKIVVQFIPLAKIGEESGAML